MLATENERRSAAESYVSATGASSLRMEAHRVGAVDSLAAAGMSPYQTGLLLLRLQGEWDRAAKPKPPTRRDIATLAGTYKVEPVLIDGDLHCGPRRHQVPNKNAGLVEQQRAGRHVYRKPFDVAEEEANRGYLHELGILFGHLKTLPEVRTELEWWIGGPHAARAVADTLAWWLEPRCQTCRGAGKRIIQGTGGRDSGKICYACRLSPVPGERPLSHSSVGRRLLAHIRACVGTASQDQNVTQPRSQAKEHQRGQDKKHAQIAKLRRADEETKQDAQQDNEKTAQHFARSMGVVV